MFNYRTTPIAFLRSFFLIFIGLAICVYDAGAANRDTRATGNWNTAGGVGSGTWSGIGLGCLAVTGGTVPAASDNANICNGSVVTVTAAASITNLTVNDGLIINTGQTLTISGTLTINNGGTVTINGTGAINITGDAIINAGGSIIFAAGGNGTIAVSGNWTNNGGTLTTNNQGTVTFNGGMGKAINGTSASQTFYNVVIAKNAGVTLSASGLTSLTVNNFTESSGDFTAPATVGTGTLNVNVDILINSGTFTSTGTINLIGNLTNNSTYNGTSQSLNFTGAINAIVSGTGAWTLNNVTMNKSALATILEIQAAAFSNAIGGGKTLLTMGTFKHNSTGTWNYMDDSRLGVPTTNFSINSNVKLWIVQGTVNLVQNGIGRDVNATTGVASGNVQVDGGILNAATGADNYFNICSSNLTVNGGTVNIGGTTGSSGGIRFYKPVATVPGININGGTVNVYGTLTEAGGVASAFSMSGGTLNLSIGSSAPGTYTFQIQNIAASSFTMSNGTIILQKPTGGGGDFDICGTNGTVNVTGGTVQFGTATTAINKTFVFTPYISASANNLFPNIKLAGTNGDKLVSKATVISDFRFLSLYISANNTFDFVNSPSSTLKLMGTSDGTNSFYNDGTLTQQTSTVIFNGTISQHISGATNTIFNNLTINNASGVILDSPETVNAAMTLTSGIVTTSAVNILALTSTATSTSGSTSSFVSGPMSKNGTTAFSFPVGKGTSWMRIDISAPTASSTFIAEYFNVPYVNITSVNLPLDNVSHFDYWQLNRTVGTGDVFVTLHWENASASGINDCPDLTIARWNGAAWDEVPGTTSGGSVCSGAGTGTVVSNAAVTAFGPFSFGSKGTSVNPLPIELLSFNAVYNGKTVDLAWKTASETNNDYFTIERSKDGVFFEIIGLVDGAGNSNSILNYKFEDNYPLKGSSYYRLKQTDFDNNHSYSGIIPIENNSVDMEFNVFPNPTTAESIHISVSGAAGEEVLVVLYNPLGEEVYSKLIINSGGTFLTGLDPSKKLTPGIYLITGTSKNEVFRQKLIIK